jgi:hypothetical protein
MQTDVRETVKPTGKPESRNTAESRKARASSWCIFHGGKYLSADGLRTGEVAGICDRLYVKQQVKK